MTPTTVSASDGRRRPPRPTRRAPRAGAGCTSTGHDRPAVERGQPGGVGEHRDGPAVDRVGGVFGAVRREPGSAANRSPGSASWARSVTPPTSTSGTTPASAASHRRRAASTGNGTPAVELGRSCGHWTSGQHPTEQPGPTATKPAGSAAGPDPATAACSRAAAASDAMLWNSGAADEPGLPSAARAGASIMMPTT